MGLKFNVFTGNLDLVGSGSAMAIGSTVSGSTPHTILKIDASNNLAEVGPLTDGQLIIGQTGAAPVATTLTGTANRVSVTNGAGSITISAPQDIHTGASPTFNGMTLSSLTPAGVIHNNGSGVLSTSLVVDADVSPSAAIDLSKLESLTINRALVSDASGVVSASSVTSTELGHLSGVTSAIQTQLNNKADTNLNNLTSTSINQSLLPQVPNTFNLGDVPIPWNRLYVGSIWDGSVQRILLSGSLLDGSGSPAVDFNSNRELIDSSGGVTLTWETNQLFDSSSNTSMDWENRRLYNGANVKVDFSGNGLTLSTQANADIVLDPHGSGDIDASSAKIINVADPSALQDAATKNYVDAQVSDKANRTLSNLTSPTAINEDLIFDKLIARVKTQNKTSTNDSRDLEITSGDTVDGDAGWVIIDSGNPSGTGTPGNVEIGGNATQVTVKSVLSMETLSITNLADPVSAQDAATKAYVDSLAAGLDPKQSVRVATVADLSASYATTPSNGQFTSAPSTIDGVALSVGNRVLVKDQSDPKENGIYEYTAANELTRATDSDGSPSNEVSGGNFTFVEAGTANASKGFVLQGTGTLVLNTNNLVWTQFSAAGYYTADGQGIELSGSQFQLELDGSTLSKSSSGLKVNQIANAQISPTAAIDASKIADGSVSNAEFQYLGSVTSDIQTQLNNKAETDLSNLITTSINQSLIPDLDISHTLGTPSKNWTSVETNSVVSNAGLGLTSSAGGINISADAEAIDITSYNGVVAPTIKLFDNAANSVGIKAPNTLAADYTLTLPADDGNSGEVLTTNGSGVLSWSSNGANTTLSNLTATTAINQDLVFAKTAPVVKSENKLLTVDSQDITILTGDTVDGDSGWVVIDVGAPSGTGVAGNIELGGTATQIDIKSVVRPAAANTYNLGDTANYFSGVSATVLETIDPVSGNSIGIQAPGSLATSYSLTLPGTDGNNGEVLTTDGSGNLSWAVASGANTSLSNLTSPTAINQDLIFDKTAPILKSKNQTGVNNSQPIDVISGDVVDGISGDLTLDVGQATGTGSTGAVLIGGNATKVELSSPLRPVTPNTLNLGDSVDYFSGVSAGVLETVDTVSGNTIGIQAPASLTASYTLALPDNDGNAGEMLTTDGSGNLSWALPTGAPGDIALTSFSGANNQVAAASVTGLSFNTASIRSFEALVSVSVDATAPLYEQVKLNGIYNGTSWYLSQSSVGDTSGVSFSITNAGQVEYTSDNYAGFVSLDIKFRAIITTV